MSRPKVLVDAVTAAKAEAILDSLKDVKLVIQVKAILAVRERPVRDVARILGVSERSINRWAHRLKEGGAEALRARPKGHNRPKLDDRQQAAVEKWVVEGQTPDGRPVLWTVEKLRIAIAEEFGIKVGKTLLWLLLKKRGLVPRRPRPRHAKADPAAQTAFKKTSRTSRHI